MLKANTAVLILLAGFALAAQTTNLDEDLLAAAKKGDAKTVKALLDKGANVNAKNEYGATALSYAADKGHLPVVKILVQHKADVNSQDTFYKARRGWTGRA